MMPPSVKPTFAASCAALQQLSASESYTHAHTQARPCTRAPMQTLKSSSSSPTISGNDTRLGCQLSPSSYITASDRFLPDGRFGGSTSNGDANTELMGEVREMRMLLNQAVRSGGLESPARSTIESLAMHTPWASPVGGAHSHLLSPKSPKSCA